MSRRRNFRGGCAPRHRVSTFDFRFGGGTGYRSCRCDFQSARALGRGGKIQFHRLPLSRTGISQLARAGHELFQYLLQPARRTHLAAVFASGEPGAIRSSALDDDRKTDLVHRRISLRNPAYFIANTGNGKERHPRRPADAARRNGRPQKKMTLINCGGRPARHAGAWRRRVARKIARKPSRRKVQTGETNFRRIVVRSSTAGTCAALLCAFTRWEGALHFS